MNKSPKETGANDHPFTEWYAPTFDEGIEDAQSMADDGSLDLTTAKELE